MTRWLYTSYRKERELEQKVGFFKQQSWKTHTIWYKAAKITTPWYQWQDGHVDPWERIFRNRETQLCSIDFCQICKGEPMSKTNFLNKIWWLISYLHAKEGKRRRRKKSLWLDLSAYILGWPKISFVFKVKIKDIFFIFIKNFIEQCIHHFVLLPSVICQANS